MKTSDIGSDNLCSSLNEKGFASNRSIRPNPNLKMPFQSQREHRDRKSKSRYRTLRVTRLSPAGVERQWNTFQVKKEVNLLLFHLSLQ